MYATKKMLYRSKFTLFETYHTVKHFHTSWFEIPFFLSINTSKISRIQEPKKMEVFKLDIKKEAVSKLA